MEFFQGTQERVRNSRGKQAISVRATEVLLYLFTHLVHFSVFEILKLTNLYLIYKVEIDTVPKSLI